MRVIGQQGDKFVVLVDPELELSRVVDIRARKVSPVVDIYKVLERGVWNDAYDQDGAEIARAMLGHNGEGQKATVGSPPPLTVSYADVAYPPLHPYCLVDGQSPIYTSKGWVAIRKVEKDDLVLTHKGRFRKVTETIRIPKQTVEVTRFSLEDKAHGRSSLTLTSDHPVLMNGQWRPISELEIGDTFGFLANQCEECEWKTFEEILSQSGNGHSPNGIHYRIVLVPIDRLTPGEARDYDLYEARGEDVGWRRIEGPRTSGRWGLPSDAAAAAVQDAGHFEFVDLVVKQVQRWILRKPRTLYNLSVEEDESYIAKGFVVHNCRCSLLPVIEDIDVSRLPTEFAPAKTLKDAEAFAKTHLANKVSYKGTDLRAANLINEGLYNNSKGGKLTFSEIGPLSKKEGSRALFKVSPDGNTFKFGFSQSTASSYDEIQQMLTIMEKDGFIKQAVVKDLITHEFGHRLDVAGKLADQSFDFFSKYTDLYPNPASRELIGQKIKGKLGSYWGTNRGEMFAESYRAYKTGILPKELGFAEKFFANLEKELLG